MKESVKRPSRKVRVEAEKSLFPLILGVAYIAVGVVLAVPYAFLADGRIENAGLYMFVAPIVAFIVWALWIVRTRHGRHIPRWVGVAAIAIIGYLGLPILFHSISIACGWMGWTTASGFIFEFRYWSLMMFAFLGVAVLAMRKRQRRNAQVSGTTPPGTTGGDQRGGWRQWGRWLVLMMFIALLAFGVWTQETTVFRQMIGALLAFSAAHRIAFLIIGGALAAYGLSYAIFVVGLRPRLGQPIRMRDQFGYAALVAGKAMLLYAVVGMKF